MENQFDLAWRRVITLTGWTQKSQLADYLSIKRQSVSSARKRNSFPLEWAYKIASEFGESAEWILEGKGGPRALDNSLEDAQSGEPNKAKTSPEDAFDSLDMAEGIGLLAEIYRSKDNIYIRAINANLLAFSDAVKTKAKMADMAERMQEQFAKMEEKLNALEREVVRLRHENGELKRELRARSDKDDPLSATG